MIIVQINDRVFTMSKETHEELLMLSKEDFDNELYLKYTFAEKLEDVRKPDFLYTVIC